MKVLRATRSHGRRSQGAQCVFQSTLHTHVPGREKNTVETQSTCIRINVITHSHDVVHQYISSFIPILLGFFFSRILLEDNQLSHKSTTNQFILVCNMVNTKSTSGASGAIAPITNKKRKANSDLSAIADDTSENDVNVPIDPDKVVYEDLFSQLY